MFFVNWKDKHFQNLLCDCYIEADIEAEHIEFIRLFEQCKH